MKIALVLLALLVSVSHQTDESQETMAVQYDQEETGRVSERDPKFLFFYGTSTVTKLSLTTVTSTATTVSVITCIPSTYFSSSTACRRRRIMSEDSGLNLDQIQPSQKQEVVPSVVGRELDQSVPQIDSSQDEDQPDDPINFRHPRAKYILTTTTVSSTFTSYTFNVTTYTKTLFIGSTTSVLLCLPSGFTKC